MARIVRWNSSHQPLHRTMDRLFADAWRATADSARLSLSTPAIDVLNHEDRVEVVVDLPGVAPDDVNIDFKDGLLTIWTQWEEPAAQEGVTYTHRERYQGAYKRSLRIPETINMELAEAHFDNGVLTLVLPQREEAQPLRIPVKGLVKEAE